MFGKGSGDNRFCRAGQKKRDAVVVFPQEALSSVKGTGGSIEQIGGKHNEKNEACLTGANGPEAPPLSLTRCFPLACPLLPMVPAPFPPSGKGLLPGIRDLLQPEGPHAGSCTSRPGRQTVTVHRSVPERGAASLNPRPSRLICLLLWFVSTDLSRSHDLQGSHPGTALHCSCFPAGTPGQRP